MQGSMYGIGSELLKRAFGREAARPCHAEDRMVSNYLFLSSNYFWGVDLWPYYFGMYLSRPFKKHCKWLVLHKNSTISSDKVSCRSFSKSSSLLFQPRLWSWDDETSRRCTPAFSTWRCLIYFRFVDTTGFIPFRVPHTKMTRIKFPVPAWAITIKKARSDDADCVCLRASFLTACYSLERERAEKVRMCKGLFGIMQALEWNAFVLQILDEQPRTLLSLARQN